MTHSSPSNKERFKVIGRYCLPWLESVKTFATYEEAKQELRRWKAEAKAQGGQKIMGRVVAAAGVEG